LLTDHDGMYGAARFNDTGRQLGVRVGFGAELSLDLPAPQAGQPDAARAQPRSAERAYGKLVDRWVASSPRTSRRAERSRMTYSSSPRGSRHLGIHSGGMVISKQPVSEVDPIEGATMADRKAPLGRRSRQRRAGSPATKAARARFIVGRKGTQAAARSGFWA
jgi:hypothetical protein